MNNQNFMNTENLTLRLANIVSKIIVVYKYDIQHLDSVERKLANKTFSSLEPNQTDIAAEQVTREAERVKLTNFELVSSTHYNCDWCLDTGIGRDGYACC